MTSKFNSKTMRHFVLTLALSLMSLLCFTQENMFGQTVTIRLLSTQTDGSFGIRGNKRPLSWEKSIPLTGPDAQGYFSAEIAFPSSDDYVPFAEIKFIRNEKEWEALDNRVLMLLPNQEPKLFVWNRPESLSPKDLPSLSGEKLLADAGILLRAFEQLHPGLLRYRTREEITLAKKIFSEQFARAKTLPEAYLAVSRFTGFLQCGHTYANFSNQNALVAATVFNQPDKLPFTFQLPENRMIVTESFDPQLPKGAEILRLNEKPVSEILDSLQNLVKADGSNHGKRLSDLEVSGLGKFEPFDIYFPLVFPPEEGFYSIEFETILGEKKTARLSSVSSAWRKNKLADVGITAPDSYDSYWSFSHPSPETGVLKLGTFVTWKMKRNWRAYLDSVFTSMNQKKTPHLILDIRGNEGGDNDVIDYLLQKLAKKSNAESSEKRLVRFQKAPENLISYLNSWDNSWKNIGKGGKIANARFIELKADSRGKSYKADKKAFQGNVWLLVDASNSSATFMLANLLKESGLATVVGGTTGGNQRGINGGKTVFLRLPYSGIEVDFPLIGYFFDGKPDAGLEPDIKILPSVANIRNGIDPVMERVKKEILEMR